MSHVSLRDVAERAGVSFQTVGKALRGEGRVSPATRQRIQEAADALGYVPNTVARSLKTQSTRSIGFVASGLASFVLAPIMRGVEREATAQGFFPIFTLAERDEAHVDRLVRQLIERRVDGLVSAALAHQSDQPLRDLLRGTVPSVTVLSMLGGNIPVISDDWQATGHLAATHLRGLGHTRAAAISGEPVGNPRDGRLRSFAEASGITDPSWYGRMVVDGSWSAEGGYAAMQEILHRGHPFTAVFALNDHMALGAMHALREQGLRIPEDVSVVGCDDIELARFASPPLTTLRISFEEMGIVAVRLLLRRMAEPDVPLDNVTLPVELIVRQTTAAANPR